MSTTEARLHRLRFWVIALAAIVAFAAVAAPYAVITTNQRQASETQLTVSCTSAESNKSQLKALREISDQLGVPVRFTVPPVPPECEDV